MTTLPTTDGPTLRLTDSDELAARSFEEQFRERGKRQEWIANEVAFAVRLAMKTDDTGPGESIAIDVVDLLREEPERHAAIVAQANGRPILYRRERHPGALIAENAAAEALAGLWPDGCHGVEVCALGHRFTLITCPHPRLIALALEAKGLRPFVVEVRQAGREPGGDAWCGVTFASVRSSMDRMDDEAASAAATLIRTAARLVGAHNQADDLADALEALGEDERSAVFAPMFMLDELAHPDDAEDTGR